MLPDFPAALAAALSQLDLPGSPVHRVAESRPEHSKLLLEQHLRSRNEWSQKGLGAQRLDLKMFKACMR